jgi:hypothetical protein
MVVRRARRSLLVGTRPSSSPSARSRSSKSSLVAKRRGMSPATRFAPFQLPKCSMTVCGCTRVRRSVANSRIVGDRPSRSAQAFSSATISSSE